MKLLIFHPALAPYRITLFNAIGRRFVARFIFLRKNLLDQKFDQALLQRQLTADFGILDNGFNVGGYMLRWGLFKEIAAFNPDIIVSSEYSVQSCLLACYQRIFRPRWKLIVYTADTARICATTRGGRRMARYFCLKCSHALWVYSEPVREWYAQRFKRLSQRIFICPNIQDASLLRERFLTPAVLETAETILGKWNLRNKKILLFVGRFSVVKNLSVLLDAFALSKSSDTMLVLLGSGEQEALVHKKIEQLGLGDKVCLPGHLEGSMLFAWYMLASALILPSLSETYGAVVVEALSFGVPCLVSEAAGAADLIRTKDHGVLIDPASVEDIAMKIAKFLAHCPTTTAVEIRPSLYPLDFWKYLDEMKPFLEMVYENGNTF